MKTVVLVLFLLYATQSNKLLNLVRRLHQEEIEPANEEEPDEQNPNEAQLEDGVDDEPPKKNLNDDVFDLGPLSDQNADVYVDRHMNMTSFEKLMHLGVTTNHYYNSAISLNEASPDENEEVRFTKDLERYEATKELLFEIYFRNNHLEEEVERFYKNLDLVRMTSEELLRFFDFYERYRKVMLGVSIHTPEYEQISTEFESLVDEYNDKMKGFFKGIDNLRHPDVYFWNFANKHRSEFFGVLDDTEKIEIGQKMAEVLVNFGEDFYQQFANIEAGLIISDSIRAKLYNTIEDLSTLIPDEKYFLGSESSSGASISLIGCITAFILFY